MRGWRNDQEIGPFLDNSLNSSILLLFTHLSYFRVYTGPFGVLGGYCRVVGEYDGEGLQSRVQVEHRDVGIGDGIQEGNSGTQELKLGDVIREKMSLEGVETRVEL